MMRMLGLGLLLSVLTTPGVAQSQLQSPPTCGSAKLAMSRWMAGMNPNGSAATPVATRDTTTDVLHYALDLEIDPLNHWLGGSNTMTVRSQLDGLQTFQFRLHDVFTVTDLTVGGTSVPWSHVDEQTIALDLDRTYNADEVFAVYIAYNGTPLSQGGWGSITIRDRNGVWEAFTLSQPWYAYTWWPAKDDLEDKTTADLWFTVPDALVVASNGVLQGVDNVAPGQLRYRWRTQYQTADYLYCFAATNYDQFGTTWSYDGHDMPLQFFIYPEDNTPQNQDYWLNVAPALTTYSDLFGLYPFADEKYGMAQFGWAGGMEHQTITSIAGYFTWEDGIMHELAHQWWGDHVTCATWHDIWLNEGFATYCEALWYENKPDGGADALHAEMAQRRPTSTNGSVYCYDISDPNRIFSRNLSYLKGAWVLHMLRHVVGDDAFFDILAAWRAAYAGASGSSGDFESVAAAVTGRDLSWFFGTWLYGNGVPRYRYAWRLHTIDFQTYLELYIKQVQSASLPTFTMPIDVLVDYPDGIATTHVVWNDAPEEHVLFRIDEEPISGFQFDPTPWILSAGATETVFLEGPTKIIRMIPAPNEIVASADITAFEVQFHKDVIVTEADIWIEGTRTGLLACAFSYDADRFAVRLIPTAAVPTDTYSITVNDSIFDVPSGFPMDGELYKVDGAPPLPSGDGLPGGPAFAQFTVTATADTNCDGVIDFADIAPFVLAMSDPAAFGAAYPGCPIQNADANHDGTVSTDDVDAFVEVLSEQ